MELKINQISDKQLEIQLIGRMDTVAAGEAEKDILAALPGVECVTINCAELFYVASAGLRTFLLIKKKMDESKGQLTITRLCPDVEEVFKLTGFNTILRIE